MTLNEVKKIRAKWAHDAGVAAKDVLLLCDEIQRLHDRESKLLYDAECLKTIIEAGVTHEQE